MDMDGHGHDNASWSMVQPNKATRPEGPKVAGTAVAPFNGFLAIRSGHVLFALVIVCYSVILMVLVMNNRYS